MKRIKLRNGIKNRNLVFILLLFPLHAVVAEPYDATIHFAHRVELSVSVSGKIKHVAVNPGERIKSGKVMIALDKTPFEAAVAEAQAEVTTRDTQTKEAARDLDQAQELYDRGVLSTVELEDAQNKNIRAKAALKAAQAKLTQAKYNLNNSQVVAPFDGWVLNVKTVENENINSQLNVEPLMVFAEEGKYKAFARVPLKVLRTLNLGQAGKISVGNKVMNGKVSSLGLEPVEQGKDLYEVGVVFNSKNTLLRSGQNAVVDF